MDVLSHDLVLFIIGFYLGTHQPVRTSIVYFPHRLLSPDIMFYGSQKNANGRWRPIIIMLLRRRKNQKRHRRVVRVTNAFRTNAFMYYAVCDIRRHVRVGCPTPPSVNKYIMYNKKRQQFDTDILYISFIYYICSICIECIIVFIIRNTRELLPRYCRYCRYNVFRVC